MTCIDLPCLNQRVDSLPSLPGAPGVTVAGTKVGRHPIHARHGAATAATGAQLQLTGEDQLAHRLGAGGDGSKKDVLCGECDY